MQDARWIGTHAREAGEISHTRRAALRCSRHILAALSLSAVLAGGLARGAVTDEPSAGSRDPIVCLYATAVVTGDDIRLSHVAQISGEEAQQAADWTIAPAPPAGGSSIIDLGRVQKVLAGRGVNLARWVFRGSSRCQVVRPAAGTAAGGGTGGPPTPVPSLPAPMPPAPPDARHVDPNTLEAELRDVIARRVEGLRGMVSISFSPSVERVLALARPAYQFEIVGRGERVIGFVPLEVTVRENQQVRQVLQVVAEVSLHKPVVVTTRALNRGEVIAAADLTVQERTFDRSEDLGVDDVSAVVGQQVRRLIPKGAMVQAKDIEPVPLVQRNDLVTVWVRRGNLVIKGSVKALQSGGYGDSIDLRNERSQQVFSAVVTGPRTVELTDKVRVPASQPALAAGAP